MNPRAVSAFTLIELAAVLVLTGLLTSAVAWTMAGRQQAVVLDDVVSQIKRLDEMSRILARRFDQSITLRIDLDNQAVWRSQDNVSNDNDLRSHRLVLPSQCRLGSTITLDGTKHNGELSVTIEPTGRSISYAIQLNGVDTTEWLLVCGMTGQAREYHDEQSIQDIFTMLRHDAD